uniref:Uncharacterized protein n=1 Tax=Rhizophagus irregularis (strain DAOM 181602 / DAOM 197198 / MUCL 43194) TaxID=747089 RepID=U9SP63_RHIID
MTFILPYDNSDLPIGKNGTVHTLSPKKDSRPTENEKETTKVPNLRLITDEQT